MSVIIANKEFNVGTEFRHPSGGIWRIAEAEKDTLILHPCYGTRVKARGQLVGRVFKIQGVWFKVIDADPGHIKLTLKA